MAFEAPKSRNALLSRREMQVLKLAAEGLTDSAAAQSLGVSLATIATYWGRVQVKFGAYNRTELARMYLASELPASPKVPTSTPSPMDLDSPQLLQLNFELFKSLVNSAPVAILILNDQGIVELSNENTNGMFGYAKGELMGLSVDRVLPKWYHQGYLRNVSQYAANPEHHAIADHIATIAQRKDGTEFPILAALDATPSSRGMLVTCIMSTPNKAFTTQQRDAESALRSIELH